ncbi:MAG: HD domain-containing protein [Nanoarchaeota archaeon]|nr:HD domain-containing protein [Nanoarchaeota archaeon]
MEDIINFFHKIGELKKIKRAGWVLKKVPNPESVAEHSFRSAVMSLILAEKLGLDKNKCVKMALMHDIAEILSGDITPHDKISDKEKHEKEKKAIKKLTKYLDKNEVLKLWGEYEERKTKEAILVYEMDKIEMLLQAYEYEQEHKGKDINLDEFWSYVKKRIKLPHAKKMYDILAKKRTK